LGELIRLIGLRTRVVVVLGNAGTGKTALVGLAARTCGDMGLSVRRIERGDLLAEAVGDKSDVLFVDEADSMSNVVLQSFLFARDGNANKTMVFMCLPSCISRFSFSGTEAVVVELSPLSLLDARLYLTGRGNSIGRTNLFTPQALDLIIDASKGVPRLLRSIASLAYFNAAVEGASQIAATHAEAATSMRNELSPLPSVTPYVAGPSGEPAQIGTHTEIQVTDRDAELVVASAGAAGSAAENEAQSLSRTAVFGRTSAARDRWSFRTIQSVAAVAIVLLIAGAGGFELISGHTPRNREPEPVSASPAIASVQPAERAVSPPSTERAPATIAASPDSSAAIAVARSPEVVASPLTSKRAPTATAPATHRRQASASSPRNREPRSAATETKTHDLNICSLAQSSRDVRALPLAGRCPEAQLAYPGNATPSSPALSSTPRVTEVDQGTQPATDAVSAPQRLPAQPVRTAERTQPPAQIPSQAPTAPVTLQPTLPAVAARTGDRGEVAGDVQEAGEEKESLAPKEFHLPVVIFGLRLW
jgi:hypothetical protein